MSNNIIPTDDNTEYSTPSDLFLSQFKALFVAQNQILPVNKRKHFISWFKLDVNDEFIEEFHLYDWELDKWSLYENK